MLSYRHAFHAGNHADVLKHYVLRLVLEYATQKEKPFWYIDTHAGAGLYRLDDSQAMQNAEFEQGIKKLMALPQLPPSLADYVAHIRSFNQDRLQFYPGSPAIAQQCLRSEDKMRLFELHPKDYQLLASQFSAQGRQVRIEKQDGFAGIKACLPPPPRRAVILMDPPYEEKQDYQRVVSSMKDSLSRFATGTYILWYPILQRPEPEQMLEDLRQLPIKNWLHTGMTVATPAIDGFGMHGSGLFIINPPWTLEKTLTETLPVLTQCLAQDENADYFLRSQTQ